MHHFIVSVGHLPWISNAPADFGVQFWTELLWGEAEGSPAQGSAGQAWALKQKKIKKKSW